MSGFIVGVDLGQADDYTAIVVGEWAQGEPEHLGGPYPKPVLHVRYLDQFRHLSYTEVVARIDALMAWPALAGARLVVDATGVGRPVVDLLRERHSRIEALTITSGATATTDNGEHHVPKRDLVAAVQVLLQSNRLKIAKSLPLTKTLIDQLANFQVRISAAGHDSYAAARSGHDDLVLALEMTAWVASRGGPGRAFLDHWRRAAADRRIDVPRRDWRADLALVRAGKPRDHLRWDI